MKILKLGDMKTLNSGCTLMVVFAFVLINTGCSINSFGFPGSIEEQSTYSDFSHIIRTKATGVHLDTRAAFEFHIGYMEREIVYPRITDDISICTQQFLAAENVKPSNDTLIYSEEPIKISVQAQGVRLSLSPHYIGVSIGYVNRKVLRIEKDSSFSMFYNNEKKQGIQVCAVIESKPQGEHHEN